MPETSPTPTGMLRPGTIIGEVYRVLGHVGSGGVGDVYLAKDTNLGRKVAIKLIREVGNLTELQAAPLQGANLQVVLDDSAQARVLHWRRLVVQCFPEL